MVATLVHSERKEGGLLFFESDAGEILSYPLCMLTVLAEMPAGDFQNSLDERRRFLLNTYAHPLLEMRFKSDGRSVILKNPSVMSRRMAYV